MRFFFKIFILFFIFSSFIFSENSLSKTYKKTQRKVAKKVVKKQIDVIENEIVLDVLFDDKPNKKRNPELQRLINELKKEFHKKRDVLKEQFRENKKLLKESRKNKVLSKKEYELSKEKIIIDEESSFKELRIDYRLRKEIIIKEFKSEKRINRKTQKQIKNTLKKRENLKEAKEVYDLIK